MSLRDRTDTSASGRAAGRGRLDPGAHALRPAAALAAAVLLAGGMTWTARSHAGAAVSGPAATSPFGLWKTIDDHTGKPRALVRIYRQDGELFGRIEQSFTPGAESRVCQVCRDERHDQPMIGLVIIRHLKPDGDGWSGGDILDPDSGTVYRCKLHVESGGAKLVVRGYIGFSLLGRSQTWWRQNSP